MARAVLGLALLLAGVLWANGALSNERTAGAPVGVAQAFGAVNTTATSTLTATTAGTGAGDLLVATIRDRSPTSSLALVSSVTDSASNHWVRATSVTQNTQNDGEIWYAASANGITTVTVKLSINAALAFTVLDITGATATPLDKTAVNSGVGINPSVGPTTTTSQGSEIAVADIGWNTPLTPSNQTAGYTLTSVEQSTVSSTATGEQAAWRVLSTPSALSYAAGFPPSSSVAWTGTIATFNVGTPPTPTATATATATTTATATATTTPTTTPTPPPTVPHVMVIVEDSQEYGSVIGSSNAPYLNSLVTSYSSATSWFAVQHSSPTAYLELLSGSNQGFPNGSPYATNTLVDELHSKNIPWQGYLESMPSNCFTGTTSNGLYDPTHNPFRYFTNYNSSQAAGWCSTGNLSSEGALPYPGASGLVSALSGANAPNFVWITPNDCNDMLGDTKSGSTCRNSNSGQLIKAGDNWLSSNLVPVLTSSWFKQNGTVIITWSQGTTNTGCCGLVLPAGGHIPTVVVTSNNKNLGAFAGSGDHYGTLAAIEKAYGVGLLGGSTNTANGDLTGAFGTPVTPGTISGTVKDSVTNAVIAGATVSYSGGSTATNGSGVYTLNNVAPATYAVTASINGYTTQSPSVTVSAGATTTQNFTLTPLPATISGTVTDAQTSHVIAGATVSYSGGNATATTNSSGHYSLSVAEGTYTVTAAAPSHSSFTSAPVTVGPGGSATQNLALSPQAATGSLNGQVTDGVNSASLVGASVAYSSGANNGTATTGSNGMYVVTGLAPGTYSVTASDNGYSSSQTASVTVTGNATATKNFALAPKPGAISGSVTDGQTHAAISGATVTYAVHGGLVPMVVISSHSSGQGAVVSPGNNYGTLRSIEEAFGLNLLGSAGNAANGDLSSSFGTAAGARHVMVITEENQGYAATLGSCGADPYYCSLASTYASYTHWYGVSHPSLPNYLAIDSGGAQGCSLDSCPGPYSATDLGGQLTAANIPWTAYMETMPSPCYTGALSGTYAKKHNPFVYFTDVLNGACATNVLPYPGSSAMVSALNGSTPPSFVWITPNLMDDMHDGTVRQGDTWLSANLGPVLSSSWFTGFNSTVIVTMDEHSGDNTGVGDPGTAGGTTTTAGGGIYGFNAVTEGNYTVTASAPGYASQSAPMAIGPGGAATQSFALVPQPGTISGTVTDVQTSQPITGAAVSYSGPGGSSGSMLSGTGGTYSFASLPEGSYAVTATPANYVAQTNTVNVTPGATSTQNFAVVPQPGTISGTVRDSANVPILNATVAYSGPGTSGGSGNTPASTTDGTYSLTSLIEGSYQVTASATGYSPQTFTVNVAPGATTSQDFALTILPGSISGTVTDSVTTAPVGGAVVSYSGPSSGSTTAGTGGAYMLSNLPPGSYMVTPSYTGYITPSATSVVVTTAANTAQDLQLAPTPGSVSGTVTDMVTGAPLTGATVSYAGPNNSSGTFPTAADGKYSFSNLTEGSYQVTAAAANYSSQTLPVNVAPAGTPTQDFPLVPNPGSISGTVMDSVNNAIAGATVAYTGPGGSSGNAASANDGTYSLLNLAEGSYSVAVTASGYVPQTIVVTVAPGAATPQNFALTILPGSISGTVIDSGTSAAIVGTTVSYSGPASGSTTTGTGGAYTLSNLAPGTYMVTPSYTGYSTPSATSVVVTTAANTPQDLQLAPIPGSVSGTVTDNQTSQPITGATVSYAGPNSSAGTFTTLADGKYTFGNLTEGSYQFALTAANYTSQALTLNVAPGVTNSQDFPLAPQQATISGTVTNQSTSAAISGAVVSYSGGSGTATTGSSGGYTLAVTEGTYTVTASAIGYAPSSAAVTLGPGGSATQSFALGITRDPLVQPFTSTSIWNMPIGSGAQYIPANLVPAKVRTLANDQHIIVMTPTAPSTELHYNPAGWGGGSRCATTGSLLATVPIPGSFVVPTSGENNGLAAVAADGHTLIQGEPFARCTAGGAGTLLVMAASGDLYSDGLVGINGGSGLSTLGGTIRLGELVPGGVISHAFQIDVDAPNLYRGTTSTCYRWPATKCDGYGPTGYGGTNPALAPGALLALPQTLDINSLNLQTGPGRILATAFQNYGAYIGNDAARSVNSIVTELSPSGSVTAEFQAAWGFPFVTSGVNGTDGWSHDIAAIFAALNIVNNNSPTSIGGGGTPLRPLAPPLQASPAGAAATSSAFTTPGSSHGII